MKRHPIPNADADCRRAFLEAMAQHAAAVGVVTVAHGAEVQGITVSSVVSLSADPPMLMFSLCRSSRIPGSIERAAEFGVALLAADQEAVARACALRDRGPLPPHWLQANAHGEPRLTGVCASFSVQMTDRVVLADHMIIAGRVRSAQRFDRLPLLYHRRRYRRLPDDQRDPPAGN